jgi:hypothetical protein
VRWDAVQGEGGGTQDRYSRDRYTVQAQAHRHRYTLAHRHTHTGKRGKLVEQDQDGEQALVPDRPTGLRREDLEARPPTSQWPPATALAVRRLLVLPLTHSCGKALLKLWWLIVPTAVARSTRRAAAEENRE